MTPIFPVLLPVPSAIRQLTGRKQVQALSRHSRRTLDLSARRAGAALGELQKNDAGAPLPSRGWYWSVSHKREIVAGVVARCPIGIDVEIQRPVSAALCRRIATPAEWSLAGGMDERVFFRFWTAKEAVLKAVGTGMKALSQCCIWALEDVHTTCVRYQDQIWRVGHHYPPPYVAAVTHPGGGIDWQLAQSEREKP